LELAGLARAFSAAEKADMFRNTAERVYGN
jgi:hypothetical protein